MSPSFISRRKFMTGVGAVTGVGFTGTDRFSSAGLGTVFSPQDQPDYTLHIKASAIEIARCDAAPIFSSRLTIPT
jgi:hypothetical protein